MADHVTPPPPFRERRWARALRRAVLPRLPGRIARYGHRLLGRVELHGLADDAPLALLVTHDLSRSGAPLLIFQIASILRENGWRVAVISPVDGPFGDALRDDGTVVIVDPRPPAASPVLTRLARRARIAICNTIDTAAAARVVAPLVPTLLYLHEVSLLETRIEDADVRAAITGAATVWAGSPMCQALLLPVRPDAVVVPYGVDPIAPPSPLRADAPLRVGVFGSIEPRKGQDLAVAGYAGMTEALRADIGLELFGRILDPGFAAQVAADAAKAGATLHGELDRDGYVAAMARMDAVLVSSRDDTLPIVSIDALGLGKLLLLVPSVGTATWLDDGVDALVGTETSAAGVRDLLERAARARGDTGRIGAAARDAHRRHFSPASFRARLLDAVATMVAAR